MSEESSVAMLARGPLRRLCSFSLLATSILVQRAAAQEGTVKLMWPLHLHRIPVSSEGASALETPEFGKELAELALRGFEEYENRTLPRELELDKPFADEFYESDHSRVNLAFRRWQKRVFGGMNDLVVPPGETVTGAPGEITLAGGMIRSPRFEEIDYTWPELYSNATFKKLKNRINELAKVYLKRSGMEGQMPKKFRIFVWAEVFRKGDALRPSSHTDGGLLMGRYWPQLKKNSLKFNFEDPRGINPPFGKTHHHDTDEGHMTLFPTWASHFISPNMKKKTAVCYAFIVYSPDDWVVDFEDDATGHMLIQEPLSRFMP